MPSLEGNRKLIVFILAEIGIVLLGAMDKVPGETALEYINYALILFLGGNLGVHGVNAYKSKGGKEK